MVEFRPGLVSFLKPCSFLHTINQTMRNRPCCFLAVWVRITTVLAGIQTLLHTVISLKTLHWGRTTSFAAEITQQGREQSSYPLKPAE